MVLERKPTNPEPPNAAALGGEEPENSRADRQGAGQIHKRAKRPQGLRLRAMQAVAKFHFQSPPEPVSLCANGSKIPKRVQYQNFSRASIIGCQRLSVIQKISIAKVSPEPGSWCANGSESPGTGKYFASPWRKYFVSSWRKYFASSWRKYFASAWRKCFPTGTVQGLPEWLFPKSSLHWFSDYSSGSSLSIVGWFSGGKLSPRPKRKLPHFFPPPLLPHYQCS